MNQNRKHDKEIFYKYMPASTALKVLENNTLRWSSPVEFNDPFDVPRELAYNVESKELKVALCNIFSRLIKEKDINISHLTPKTQKFLDLIRSSEAGVKNNIISKLSDPKIPIFELSSGLEELREVWRTFIPELRILCLSERYDSASMWYHYADKYKGIVLGIACHDELDSPWLLARPVDYPTETPKLFTAEGWAELIITPQEMALPKILDAYTYTKIPDWSYEQEWRITSFKRPNETGTTSDYNLHPSHFSKMYLGPHIDKNNRQQILSLFFDKMPQAKAYDVTFGLDRKFKFTFIM